MSNRLDMKKDTNNRKDKTKYDGPEKPDAYMGNDKRDKSSAEKGKHLY